MNMNKKIRKVISVVLTLCIIPSYIVTHSYAVTTDCTHHIEHTTDCGYMEAVAGQPCTHEHSENCFTLLDCQHIHGDCGYSEGTPEVPCGHQHDENCGYSAGVEGKDCTHNCAEHGCTLNEDGTTYTCLHETHDDICGYSETIPGQPCNHTEHTDCGYAPAVAGTLCNHVCENKMDSADSCYKLQCPHTEEGQHDENCGYIAAVPGTDCDYHCRICSVQELVDALPGEVIAENADAVAAQLSAIDTAKADLSTEELEQIDFTRYTAMSEALGSFQAAVPIPEDETSVISVNITWGGMNFTYTDENGWTDNGTGWVEVENTGNTRATVTANYQNNDGFNFTGTFEETTTDNITRFVLLLSGRPTQVLNGELIGKVTLTIE